MTLSRRPPRSARHPGGVRAWVLPWLVLPLLAGAGAQPLITGAQGLAAEADAASARAAASPPRTGLQRPADSAGSGATPDFLPVEQAFRVTTTWLDQHTLALRLDVTPGYYLYRDRVTLRWQTAGAAAVALDLPAGDRKEDPYFGPLQVFHHAVDGTATVGRPSAGAPGQALVLTWQGCAEAGLCYPPQRRVLPLP